MKKISLILLILVLIVICCSCSEENTFVEGNLLYDLGAESFEDIESVELYGGCKITGEEDIELFSCYTYSPDYPKDKLDGLKITTENSIFLYINGNRFPLCLSDNGCLLFFTDDFITVSKAKVYEAHSENRVTISLLEEWREKYK